MNIPVLGIAGGSASGKTTVTQKILAALEGEPIALLDQDSYYKDLSHLPMEERRGFNFDHPESFDNELMVKHLDLLRAGKAVEKPIYSFKEYARQPGCIPVQPGRVIIVEGILALAIAELRRRMTIKIFVEADDDIRFIRRLTRDVKDRGRTIDAVVSQYLETVRPMHLTFVEPSKRYADVIIPSAGPNDVAIGVVISAIRHRMREG
jgi:uridine kinase